MSELTTEQMESLCAIAEEAAKKRILLKVSLKKVEMLNISVEAEGAKPLNLSVDVDLVLATDVKSIDSKELACEATKEVLKAADEFLRNLK